MCNSKHDGRTKTLTPGNVQHESQVTCYGSLSLAQCQTLFYNTNTQDILGLDFQEHHNAFHHNKKKDFTNYHHMDMLVTPENFGVHYFTALKPTSETFNGLVKKIKHAKTKTLTITYQGFYMKQSLTWHHWNK